MVGTGVYQEGDEFDVALSFASENRSYVQQVAEALTARGIRIFYDANEEIYLWGKHLEEVLQQVYMRDSHAVVMFVSKPYAEKEWTRHERRSALERAIHERREYVLPARFDKVTQLDGLSPGIVYQDLTVQSPEELASKITQKLIDLGIVSKQLPKAQRESKHPYLTIERRSPLPDHGSLFWIDPTWKDDPKNKSWSEYADVLVRLQEKPVEGSGRIFLIPSGVVPPSLSDPKCWGTTGRERKRAITNSWCEANLNKEQVGYVFQMTNKVGKKVTRIYCDEYDRYLKNHV
jgi:hypothetical protein